MWLLYDYDYEDVYACIHIENPHIDRFIRPINNIKFFLYVDRERERKIQNGEL